MNTWANEENENMKKKPKKVFYCRYCGKPWNEDYLADLCFNIDMDELQKDKIGFLNKKKRKNDK